MKVSAIVTKDFQAQLCSSFIAVLQVDSHVIAGGLRLGEKVPQIL